ncbi:MAG: Sir2 family NAD-dependent protein deacetylase [Chloroflexi bacterium]|nr:Sir2 family NAD-dependent protein deacetylase [Chloroflexota bacterium]
MAGAREHDGARLAELLRRAGAGGTVVFTGAGASTESGIPGFRSPNGLWTRYAPIGYRAYVTDRDARVESWARGIHTYAAIVAARPNAAHLAIAEWWQAGRVSGVITQNIDGLHQRAGLPAEHVVELHGNSHLVACLACGDRSDRDLIHTRLRAGEDDPACTSCGGMLKSTTISFGQPLDPTTVQTAKALLREARLCLIVGSSLVVQPAASLPGQALASGARLAIVNAAETYLDDRAELVSRVPAGQLLGYTTGLLVPTVNAAPSGRASRE